MQSVLLALASGILLGLAFPPFPFGVLAFVAYVPLMILWTDGVPRFRKRHIVGLTYVTFFVFHGMSNWWVGSWQEHTDPYLLASGIALWLGHPFFLALPWYVLAYVRRRLGTGPMLLSSPFVVCAFEWLHGQSDASYPWLTTGMMTVYTPFAQVAEWVGVYGLTFGVVVVDALVAAAYMAFRQHQRTSGFRFAATAVFVLACWFMVGLHLRENAPTGKESFNRSSQQTPLDNQVRRPEDGVLVHLVQPNIDPWDKWSDPRVQVKAHQRLEDSARTANAIITLQAGPAASEGINSQDRPDLVIWSETAIPFAIREPSNRPEFSDLMTWVDTSRIALLTGYSDIMIYKPGEAPPSARRSRLDSSMRFDSFNAAMVLQSGQTEIPVHRKSMLTPFAERMPFADHLTFALDWFQWGVGISSWGKGLTRDPLPVVLQGRDTLQVGTIICIESIYPQVARDFVTHGANVLCVITNDAWYNGTVGPEQHFDIARMRAIEQRRWIMRCANSGVTGFIAPDGNSGGGTSVVRLPEQTAAVSTGIIHPVAYRTLYNKMGDVVPSASLLAAFVAVIYAISKRKQRVLLTIIQKPRTQL